MHSLLESSNHIPDLIGNTWQYGMSWSKVLFGGRTPHSSSSRNSDKLQDNGPDVGERIGTGKRNRAEKKHRAVSVLKNKYSSKVYCRAWSTNWRSLLKKYPTMLSGKRFLLFPDSPPFLTNTPPQPTILLNCFLDKWDGNDHCQGKSRNIFIWQNQCLPLNMEEN